MRPLFGKRSRGETRGGKGVQGSLGGAKGAVDSKVRGSGRDKGRGDHCGWPPRVTHAMRTLRLWEKVTSPEMSFQQGPLTSELFLQSHGTSPTPPPPPFHSPTSTTLTSHPTPNCCRVSLILNLSGQSSSQRQGRITPEGTGSDLSFFRKNKEDCREKSN